MNLFKFAKRFKDDESGAVTVDWVVLTAAIVGLGIAVGTVIFPSIETIANNIDTQLTTNSAIDATLDGS